MPIAPPLGHIESVCVIVEGVVSALVDMQGVIDIILLQRRFESRNAFVNAVVQPGVVQQKLGANLGMSSDGGVRP